MAVRGPDDGFEATAEDIQRAMLDASRNRPGFVDDAQPDSWKAHPVAKKILALDIASKCGWATFTAGDPKPMKYGIVQSDGDVLAGATGVKYPWTLMFNVMAMKEKIRKIVEQEGPDVVVIEETNLGKNRYSQKFLEWLHFNVVAYFHVMVTQKGWPQDVVYINSREWRKVLGLKLTKDDLKNNAKVRKIKRDTFLSNEVKSAALKELGVRGVKNKKHLAIAFCEQKYGIALAVKDDDIADAICLGAAYIAGAQACTGYEKG